MCVCIKEENEVSEGKALTGYGCDEGGECEAWSCTEERGSDLTSRSGARAAGTSCSGTRAETHPAPALLERRGHVN